MIQLLSIYLKLSPYRIKQRILTINQTHANLSIQIKKECCFLSYERPLDLTKLYSYYLNHSYAYQLIKLLLSENYHNLTTLSQQLYVSVSSCKRQLLKLEKFLAFFRVTVLKKPFRLHGDEYQLRYFLTLLQLPQTDVPLQESAAELAELKQLGTAFLTINRPVDPSLLQLLNTSLQIAYMRIKQGHFVHASMNNYLTSPKLTLIVADFLAKQGVDLRPHHGVDELFWYPLTNFNFLPTEYFHYAKTYHSAIIKNYTCAQRFWRYFEQTFAIQLTEVTRQHFCRFYCLENHLTQLHLTPIEPIAVLNTRTVAWTQLTQPNIAQTILTFIRQYHQDQNLSISDWHQCQMTGLILLTFPTLRSVQDAF